jgi:UDP-glucose 4-epimerase
MSRILITGSNGVIGSALRVRLLRDYSDVIGFDIASKTNSEQGDILDLDRLRQSIKNVQGIIHLAAVSRVRTAALNPAHAFNVNVKGLVNLLRTAIEIRPKPWLMFVSSKEVYGEQVIFPIKENSIRCPISTYAKTKILGEQLVEASKLRTMCVRLSSVYGATNDLEERVVPTFFRQACVNETLVVNGKHKTLDLNYIDDVVEGLFLAAKLLANSKKHSIPTIHLTSGRETSLYGLAEMVVHTSSSSSKIIEDQQNINFASRFVGDTARAKKILGWMPHTSLEEGLATTYYNYSRKKSLKD